jgi:hypothetical protein
MINAMLTCGFVGTVNIFKKRNRINMLSDQERIRSSADCVPVMSRQASQIRAGSSGVNKRAFVVTQKASAN